MNTNLWGFMENKGQVFEVNCECGTFSVFLKFTLRETEGTYTASAEYLFSETALDYLRFVDSHSEF